MSASANVLIIARSRSGLAAARLSSARACRGRLSGAVIVLISFKDLVVLKDQPVAVLISGHSLRRRAKRPDQVGVRTPLLRTQPSWLRAASPAYPTTEIRWTESGGPCNGLRMPSAIQSSKSSASGALLSFESFDG